MHPVRIEQGDKSVTKLETAKLRLEEAQKQYQEELDKQENPAIREEENYQS